MMTQPKQTAGSTSLPSGKEVWVKTPNALERKRIRRKAEDAASLAAEEYLPEGAQFAAAQARVAMLPTMARAQYVAQMPFLMGEKREAMLEEFPEPQRPERTPEMSDDDFLVAMRDWRNEVKAVQEKQSAWMEAELEKAITEALALEDSALKERALQGFRLEVFHDAYRDQEQAETLLLVTRDAVNRHVPAYASLDALLEDEADYAALCAFFETLSGVTSEAVPI